MKPSNAIEAKGVGKQYILGGAEQRYDSFGDMLRGALSSPFRKFKKLSGNTSESLFWALEDIGFDIPIGQVTGVIGRNGAGKSTLLKVLSRITTPTTGEIKVRGRVASLLEVGSGFHPELTGRENIYMNASILGMNRQEVHSKLDAIVEFAEINQFLDTPVKRYSSGMYVRLAFSVAAHVDPDVLLVDEVLAVGDVKFQQRCIGKLNEVGQDGRTVIFVSHNMGLISELCSHTMYLKNGRLNAYDDTASILGKYMSDSSAASGEIVVEAQALEKLVFTTARRGPTNYVDYDEPSFIEVYFGDEGNYSDYHVELLISDAIGREVLLSIDKDSIQSLENRRQTGNCLRCAIPNGLLRPGKYVVKVSFRALRHGYTAFLDQAEISFDVSANGFRLSTRSEGIVLPRLIWESHES